MAAPGANNVPGAIRPDMDNVLFYEKTIPGYADDIDRNNYPFSAFPNQYHGVSCSRDHISKIDMFWRSQPELVCEWAVLQRTEPVYRLFYPQYQYYLGTGTDGDSFEFQLPSNGATVTQRITGTKLNEVPNQIILYAQIHEDNRFGLEWLDLKPLITNVKLSINERPDLSSDVPLYLGYRWFVENTGSTMTRSEWEASNFWVISPQQLAVDSATFVESLARVNTMSLEVTVRRPKAYKNALQQYRNSDFWPAQAATYDDAKIYATPPSRCASISFLRNRFCAFSIDTSLFSSFSASRTSRLVASS